MDQPLTTTANWGFAKKIFFRFFFVFFPLYILLTPNDVYPYSDYVTQYPIAISQKIIPWIGEHVLHLSQKIIASPIMGDLGSAFKNAELLFLIFLAIIASLIWTLLDPHQGNYNKLYYWLTVLLRYYLAFQLFGFGLQKVIKLQFMFPTPGKLLEPFGDSSPMRLAWTFMGYSKGYNYFIGSAELLGGILLLFRRTTTLGAVITIGVMSNVVAMNYSFDIIVKLFSTMLLLMAIFLLAGDIKRIFFFFVMNKPVFPAEMNFSFAGKWMQTGKRVLKSFLIGFYFFKAIPFLVSLEKKWGDNAPTPALWGIYNVETFVRNNDTIPPLQTDTTRWKQLVLGGYKWYKGYDNVPISVKLMNDSLRSYTFRSDTLKKTITIFFDADTAKKSFFTYRQPEKDILILLGKWKNDSVYVRMKKYDINNFLLVNRGFHWINEYSLNK